MPYFSITIPVYNVEKYLSECLDSVLGQTFQDFEIVILDDGSLDKSSRICDEYAKKDKRIHVIHDVNQGLLMARRRALQHVTGKYILFLDSDDYWEKDLLESVYNAVLQNDVDMVYLRYQAVDENNKKLYEQRQLLKDNELITDAGKFLCYQLATSFEYNSMVLKVIKKDKLDIEADYSLYSRVSMGEDALQSARNLENINTMLYLCNPFYNYRVNISSISTLVNEKYLQDYLKVRNVIEECVEDFFGKGSREYIEKVQYDLRGFVGTMGDLAISSLVHKSDWKKIVSEVKDSQLFQNSLKNKKQLNFISRLYLLCILKGGRSSWRIVGKLKRILKYYYDRHEG